MTREELLRMLEVRLGDTLREHGISATVVALNSDTPTVPLAIREPSSGRLPEEVLEAVESAVQDFVIEHHAEFATLFASRPDPKTLN
jgi:hypothetical protein